MLLKLDFGVLEATSREGCPTLPRTPAPPDLSRAQPPAALPAGPPAAPCLRACGRTERMQPALFFSHFLFEFSPCPGPHSSLRIMHLCLSSPRERGGRRDAQEKEAMGGFLWETVRTERPKQRHRDPVGHEVSFFPTAALGCKLSVGRREPSPPAEHAVCRGRRRKPALVRLGRPRSRRTAGHAWALGTAPSHPAGCTKQSPGPGLPGGCEPPSPCLLGPAACGRASCRVQSLRADRGQPPRILSLLRPQGGVGRRREAQETEMRDCSLWGREDDRVLWNWSWDPGDPGPESVIHRRLTLKQFYTVRLSDVCV